MYPHSPVIRTVVETFTSHTIGCVPSATKARYFVLESRELSLIQLRSNLVSQTGATLHSDGTPKFGTKFMEAQVARDKKVYTGSLGLASVPSGSVQHSFDSIIGMLQDVDDACARDGVSDASKKIVATIKNTMSCRSLVEMNFNTLLEKYRSEILLSMRTE